MGHHHLAAVYLPDLAGPGAVEPEQIGHAVAARIGDAGNVPFEPVMACGHDDLANAAAGHVPDLHVVVAVYPDDIGGVIAVEIAEPRNVPVSPQRADIAVETDEIAAVKQPRCDLARA